MIWKYLSKEIKIRCKYSIGTGWKEEAERFCFQLLKESQERRREYLTGNGRSWDLITEN